MTRILVATVAVLVSWSLLAATAAPAPAPGGLLPRSGTDFQQAIDAVAAAGGGVVTVPAGRHETKGLYLRSNVELHLEKGAELSFSGRTNDYRVVTLPYSEGAWIAAVMSVGETNVAVTGEGVIDGNGTAFPMPPEGNREGDRPRGLFFADCRQVRLDGFTLRDAGCWGVVLKRCDGVVARRVKVDSHANYNNDGFDVEARNVLIEGCDVDSGDDAYCIKSNDPSFCVEHVRVVRCVGRSFCNVFKLGTASHGTMRDIVFEDCRSEAPRRDCRDTRRSDGELFFANGRRARRTFACRGNDFMFAQSGVSVENVDGGTVENVVFRNLVLEGACIPLFVRGGTRTGRSCGIPPSDKYVFRNILFENVVGTWNSRTASSVTGVAGCRVRDVTLRNVRLRGPGSGETAAERTRPVPEMEGNYPSADMFGMMLPAYGLYVRHVDGLTLDGVTFVLEDGTFDRRADVVCEDVASTLGTARTGSVLIESDEDVASPLVRDEDVTRRAVGARRLN